jgi:hypothetical protein
VADNPKLSATKFLVIFPDDAANFPDCPSLTDNPAGADVARRTSGVMLSARARKHITNSITKRRKGLLYPATLQWDKGFLG